MNLTLLRLSARYIAQFKKIYFCKRIDDNVFLLNLENTLFYIDLTRGNSGIYCTQREILGAKSFNAPMDLKLREYCTNATLIDCHTDGNNRILCLHFLAKSSYKEESFCLEFEFTGKFTNAILLNQKRVVIEALRHLPNAKRPLQVGKVLVKLPQQTRALESLQDSHQLGKVEQMHEVEAKRNLSTRDDTKAFLCELFTKHCAQKLESAKAQAQKNLDSKKLALEKNLQNLPDKNELEHLSEQSALFARCILAHLHEINPANIYATHIFLEQNFANSLNPTESKFSKQLDRIYKYSSFQKTPSMRAQAEPCGIHFREGDIFKGRESKILQIPIPKEIASFSDLAQYYFLLSKKYAKKAQNIHLQIENLQDSLRFLDSQKALVQRVTSFEELKIFTPQKQKGKKSDKKSGTAFEVFFIAGVKVGVGKNANQNIALLKAASAEDVWLHVRDVPSSHMILFCGKTKIAESVLQKAGQILIELCGIKGGNLPVDYTKRKFVKITQGANVVYAKYQRLEFKS
ncbi:NFACT family protein [Helicobacter himalayensis]|uniref:NFACT family protein n=1 Tax=Helicobacter himalayensis TaxID=1591088 RepID=UPI000829BC09|nr:NFACT family protein [Helicobacter himalayensis]